MRKFLQAGAVSAIALMATFGSASAAENVSGDIGYSINSHFVSYGLDVWGGGGDFFGSQSTSFMWTNLALAVTDDLSIVGGGWFDVNKNVPSAIGGSLQEYDLTVGFSYNLGGGFSSSLTYGAWVYAGDVEEVIDLAIGYDDTGMLYEGFSLAPKLTWHNRVSGNGAQQVGSAIVLSVGPSFPLSDSGISLSIPAGVAFFTTDDFQGGTEGGYAYSYLGGSLGFPMTFIPEAYGAWSANFDLIAYFTEAAAIPTNPEKTFVTGSFGIKLAF